MESTSDGWMDYSQTFHDSRRRRRTDEELSLELSLEVSRRRGVSGSVLQNGAGLLQTTETDLIGSLKSSLERVALSLAGGGQRATGESGGEGESGLRGNRPIDLSYRTRPPPKR